MKYIITFSTIFIGLLIGRAAWGDSYTVDQLVELALKNSSLTKSYELNSKSKQKLAEQAGSWDNPTFEIGTENKSESGGDTKSVRFGISQTFYVPGKLSSKEKIAESEFEISQIDWAMSQLKLRGLIQNLVFEFKISKEKLNHAKDRLARLKTLEAFIKSRTFTSPQKKAEVTIVSGKLIVLQKEYFQIETKNEATWNELNSYLKLPSIPEIQTSWFKSGPNISLNSLSDLLQSNNIDLRKQIALVTQSKNESELAALEVWPGLTLSGVYSDGSGFNPEKIYGLGLSLPLPVFNAHRSARTAGRIKYQAENERLIFLKEQIAKELRTTVLNFDLAKKSVIAFPVKKIADLKKSLIENEKGFKRGQVDLLTYLEAEAQCFESLSAILEGQLDLVKSVTEIQILTGNNRMILEE